MRMKRLRVAVPIAFHAFLTALFLATGAFAQTGTTYERSIDSLTKSFTRTTMKWQSGSSGQTMIFYGVEEYKGRIAVCGLHNSSGTVPRDVLIKGLALASVSSGRQTLVEDLRFFKEFTQSRGYPRFTCKVTKYRWDPAFARIKPKVNFRGE